MEKTTLGKFIQSKRKQAGHFSKRNGKTAFFNRICNK